MKTRSAAYSVPQLLAPVGVGALGAQLCLPPCEEALRIFVWQSGLQGKARSLGMDWDRMGADVLVLGVWKKVSWGGCRLGLHFLCLVLRTWSIRAALGAPLSRASRLCLNALQSWRNLSYYPLCECQQQPHVPMTGTGARHSTGQFSSGRITPSVSWHSQDRSGSVSEQCQRCRLSLLGSLPVVQVTPSTQSGVLTAVVGCLEVERGWLQVKCNGERENDWTFEASWQPWAHATAGACKRMSGILFSGVWQCCCVFLAQHRPQRPLDLSCGELLLFSSLNL